MRPRQYSLALVSTQVRIIVGHELKKKAECFLGLIPDHRYGYDTWIRDYAVTAIAILQRSIFLPSRQPQQITLHRVGWTGTMRASFVG